MKKMFTFFFAVIIAFSLIACKDDKTPDPTDPTVIPTEPTVVPVTTRGVGYGLVHGNYVGVADVTVDEDGNVIAASFDEYFLPYSWAKVDEFRKATGYGLVHGHYVGVAELTLANNGNVVEASFDEYFLPYSWAKVDEFKSAKGYGLVHGHYVGVVDLTIANNGNVVAIKVDEYFLPYSAAKVVVADPENLPADVVAVATARGTNYYAKFFSVDGILFEGTVSGEGTAQIITYAADGIDDIEVWVQDEANARRYAEAVEAGLVYIARPDGWPASYQMADASAKQSMKKSETTYWTGPNWPLGWKGNMAAFEEAVIGTKLDADLENIVKNQEGFWTIGDIVTGATMTDFIDYYEVAQRAHANALVAPTPEGILEVVTARGTNFYSEFIVIDGVLFQGTVSGTNVIYAADGIADLEVWVQDEENAKAYVEAVDAGRFFVSDANGNPTGLPCGDASAKQSMRKSETNYWTGPNWPLGWTGNINAFNEAIIGTKLDADLENIVKNTEGFWMIGDIVSGATMTDFVDYYEVAQRAHANALAAELPEGILAVTTARGTNFYSEFIVIDGVLFQGTVTGSSIVYSAEGIPNIDLWMQNEANAKAYVEAVEAGRFFVSDANGNPTNLPCGDASAKVSMKKSEAPYWRVQAPLLGWLGNMDAFNTGIIGTQMNAELTAIVKNDQGFWVIGDVVTGSTMTDFKDYYQVAQRAYNNAE